MFLLQILIFYEVFKEVWTDPKLDLNQYNYAASKYYMGLCGTLERPCGFPPAGADLKYGNTIGDPVMRPHKIDIQKIPMHMLENKYRVVPTPSAKHQNNAPVPYPSITSNFEKYSASYSEDEEPFKVEKESDSSIVTTTTTSPTILPTTMTIKPFAMTLPYKKVYTWNDIRRKPSTSYQIKNIKPFMSKESIRKAMQEEEIFRDVRIPTVRESKENHHLSTNSVHEQDLYEAEEDFEREMERFMSHKPHILKNMKPSKHHQTHPTSTPRPVLDQRPRIHRPNDDDHDMDQSVGREIERALVQHKTSSQPQNLPKNPIIAIDRPDFMVATTEKPRTFKPMRFQPTIIHSDELVYKPKARDDSNFKKIRQFYRMITTTKKHPTRSRTIHTASWNTFSRHDQESYEDDRVIPQVMTPKSTHRSHYSIQKPKKSEHDDGRQFRHETRSREIARTRHSHPRQQHVQSYEPSEDLRISSSSSGEHNRSKKTRRHRRRKVRVFKPMKFQPTFVDLMKPIKKKGQHHRRLLHGSRRQQHAYRALKNSKNAQEVPKNGHPYGVEKLMEPKNDHLLDGMSGRDSYRPKIQDLEGLETFEVKQHQTIEDLLGLEPSGPSENDQETLQPSKNTNLEFGARRHYSIAHKNHLGKSRHGQEKLQITQKDGLQDGMAGKSSARPKIHDIEGLEPLEVNQHQAIGDLLGLEPSIVLDPKAEIQNSPLDTIPFDEDFKKFDIQESSDSSKKVHIPENFHDSEVTLPSTSISQVTSGMSQNVMDSVMHEGQNKMPSNFEDLSHLISTKMPTIPRVHLIKSIKEHEYQPDEVSGYDHTTTIEPSSTLEETFSSYVPEVYNNEPTADLPISPSENVQKPLDRLEVLPNLSIGSIPEVLGQKPGLVERESSVSSRKFSENNRRYSPTIVDISGDASTTPKTTFSAYDSWEKLSKESSEFGNDAQTAHESMMPSTTAKRPDTMKFKPDIVDISAESSTKTRTVDSFRSDKDSTTDDPVHTINDNSGSTTPSLEGSGNFFIGLDGSLNDASENIDLPLLPNVSYESSPTSLESFENVSSQAEGSAYQNMPTNSSDTTQFKSAIIDSNLESEKMAQPDFSPSSESPIKEYAVPMKEKIQLPMSSHEKPENFLIDLDGTINDAPESLDLPELPDIPYEYDLSMASKIDTTTRTYTPQPNFSEENFSTEAKSSKTSESFQQAKDHNLMLEEKYDIEKASEPSRKQPLENMDHVRQDQQDLSTTIEPIKDENSQKSSTFMAKTQPQNMSKTLSFVQKTTTIASSTYPATPKATETTLNSTEITPNRIENNTSSPFDDTNNLYENYPLRNFTLSSTLTNISMVSRPNLAAIPLATTFKQSATTVSSETSDEYVDITNLESTMDKMDPPQASMAERPPDVSRNLTNMTKIDTMPDTSLEVIMVSKEVDDPFKNDESNRASKSHQPVKSILSTGMNIDPIRSLEKSKEDDKTVLDDGKFEYASSEDPIIMAEKPELDPFAFRKM